MVKVKGSEFLKNKKPILKELIKRLSEKYKYASVLATDCIGKSFAVSRNEINLGDSMWGERGFVVRVHNGKNYSEYSFNEISEDTLDHLVCKIEEVVENQPKDMGLNSYDAINEDEIKGEYFGEVQIPIEDADVKDIVNRIVKIKDEGLAYSELVFDFRVMYNIVKVAKMFISNKKELEQAYTYSDGALFSLVRRDENTKYNFKGFSGLKGIEMLDEMNNGIKETIDLSIELLDAGKIEPGEYEVICDPDNAGLIAHEAFGHGVEMDMFVKGRAKGAEYIDKEVASELVVMHDGAKSAEHVSSYYFDDEGTIGKDTKIIDRGILKTGISDLLSAMKLGTTPTGNGKRETFERKAYARMTNTFFAAGNHKLEDMIASIKHGYLLEKGTNGMEDPKNWGIQCTALLGREIKDGKFTGKIVSPVFITGYVPDLLKSISMVSDGIELEGGGACGKGYKEWVKVSCGGPYIKTKVRLG